MNKRGFTIVELIIVIAVIAILAAIVIVGYGSWRNTVLSNQVKSDLNGVATAMESVRNTSEGYPASIPSSFAASDGVTLTLAYSSPSFFCIEGVSASNSNVKFYINQATANAGPKSGSCPTVPEEPGGPEEPNEPGNPETPVEPGQIAATVQHTCAISQNGNAYCWGENYFGQLGRGTTGGMGGSNSPDAVLTSGVLSGKTIKQISVEGDSTAPTTCVVASNDRAYCWGHGGFGKLGRGSTTNSSSPVAVSTSGVLSGKSIVKVGVGRNHVCALATDNRAYCWGAQHYGQLGNGTIHATTRQNSPVAVLITGALSGKSIKTLSVGTHHTCAVTTTDTIHCWGSGTDGGLGNGTFTTNGSPTTVVTSGVLSGKGITSVSSGGGHSCVVASDNKVYCWGNNNAGQLGNNSTADSNVPVAVNTSGVLNGLDIKAVSAGGSHTCAIASNDRIYCWGSGTYGQLGNSAAVNSSVPVAVTNSGSLNGKVITSISAGTFTSCAMASDATSYCWGRGAYGNLGTGNSTDSLVPVPTLMP